MKLICLSGIIAGRDITVPENGVTLGRGKDNDVVLEGDPQASRYHARIERVNGAWHIIDRESANGVQLNGHRVVKSGPLTDKDELRVGQNLFRIELAAGAVPTPETKPATTVPTVSVPAPVVVPSDDATPVVVFKTSLMPELVGEPVMPVVPSSAVEPLFPPVSLSTPPPAPPVADEAAKRQKRIKLLVVGLVSVLVVLPLAHWLLTPVPGTTPARGGTTAVANPAANAAAAATVAAAAAAKELHFEYEMLTASKDTFFRYELSLNNGVLSVVVDDPLNNRRVEDSRTLVPEQVKFFSDNLMVEKILQLQSPPSEGAVGQIGRVRLSVASGNRGNSIIVENTQEPAALHEAVQTLQDKAQNLFGIGAEPMPLEEAMRQAEEGFLNAHRMFEERNVDPANLYRSVKGYGMVLVRLKNYEVKPEWFAKCVAEEDSARKRLDADLAKLKRDAQALKTAGSLAEARQVLSQILDMVPNRDDHDIARWAHQEAVQLDIKLYQMRNRR